MQSKSKRPLDRPPSYKLLEGESQKLKDKLESLREQIKVKKQQKEMNKTMQPMGSFLGKNTSVEKMNATNYVQKEDKQLQMALAEMKMENIEAKLKDRNINRLQQLINTTQEEIDKWKDIPVGYRIKIKKYIQKNKLKFNPPLNVIENPLEGAEKNEKRELNIEQIIKNRKAEKVYVALDRKNQEEEEQTPQLLEEEQEKMMLSILQVISVKQRKGCLKRKESKPREEKKIVHWSQVVDEMEKNHKVNKTYPKETISKSAFQVNAELLQKQSPQSIMIQVETPSTKEKEYPSHVYCWSCLKKISTSVNTLSPRQFCSKDCEADYEATVNPVQLLRQVQIVQTRYNSFIKQRQQSQQQDLDLQIS